MPAFRRLEIWTDLGCASGAACVRALPAPIAITVTRAIAGEEQLQALLPWDATIATALQARRVLRVCFHDDSFEEWRLQDDAVTWGAPIALTAVPVLQDLADSTSVLAYLSTGAPLWDEGAADLTPAEWIDAYVLPSLAARGLTYWSRGTVEPTLPISLDWTDAPSPLAILRRVVDELQARQVGCELAVRRVGTTGYAIDLVTQRGASASVPVFTAGHNLAGLTRRRLTRQQATEVMALGADPAAAHLGRARWRVQSVGGGAVVLADPNGAAGPVAFASQFVGWHLYREKTGGTWPITAVDPATQAVTLAGGTGTIASGEYVQLRRTEPQDGTRYTRVQGYTPATAVYGHEITAVDVGTKRLTIRDGWSAADCVVFDGHHVDRHARLSTRVGVFSWAANGSDTIQLTSVTGIQVGDWCRQAGNNVFPYAGSSVEMNITAVDAGTKTITVARRHGDTTNTFPLVAPYLFVYRELATSTVRASSASSNELTVADTPSASLANGMVELRAAAGLGEQPVSLTDPARHLAPGAGGYGPRAARVARPRVHGTANLLPNPWMRTWTTPSAAPDGWSVTGATVSQNTNPLYTERGGASLFVNFNPSGGTTRLQTPAAPVVAPTAPWPVVAWVRVFLTAFSGSSQLLLSLRARRNVVDVTPANWLAQGSLVVPVDHPTPPSNATKVAPGAWLDIVFAGFDVTSEGAPGDIDGIVLDLEATATAGVPLQGYVDAAMLSLGTEQPGALAEYGDATVLHQSANAVLAALADPPTSYDVTLADLEKLDPAAFARHRLTLGGSLRVVAPALEVDATARVVAMTESLVPTPADTRVTLATFPAVLTDLVT